MMQRVVDVRTRDQRLLATGVLLFIGCMTSFADMVDSSVTAWVAAEQVASVYPSQAWMPIAEELLWDAEGNLSARAYVFAVSGGWGELAGCFASRLG